MPIEAPAKKPRPSGKGEPTLASQTGTTSPTSSMTEAPASSSMVPLNFTVDAEFRKQYRLAAAEFDVSMITILQQSFEQWLQHKRGG